MAAEKSVLYWHKWRVDAHAFARQNSQHASQRFHPSYFEQHPLLHVAFVASGVTDWFVQQAAVQACAPSAQQSQLQSSQLQTPVSQQHPPSGQQLSHAQVFASTWEFEVLA